MKLSRVSAWCVAENRASARVLEKLGMRLNGQLHNHLYYKDRWWDTQVYVILYDEWKGGNLT
jgi:ribosomal-protein-alanine N-acetyltransferase